MTEVEVPVWWRRPLAKGAQAGAYYCGLVAVFSVASRIVGLKAAHAAWGGGALVLLIAHLGLLWRSDGFGTIGRGVVSICGAVVTTVAFAFAALVVMVNILLLLGWGL